MKALARIHGPIHLTTSPICWQMVPLLWEQPYFADVDVDDKHEYKITKGIFNFWEYYEPGEGINMSSQPSFFTIDSPVSWTHCYAKVAGVTLEQSDFCVFPLLQNQRRYLKSCDVAFDGKTQNLPNYIVIAPEVETLTNDFDWSQVEDVILSHGYKAVWVGKNHSTIETTVPTLARIILDAKGFIGAHSFPWHLARHLEVPAICLQEWRDPLIRCIPIDTPYLWLEPSSFMTAMDVLFDLMEKDK